MFPSLFSVEKQSSMYVTNYDLRVNQTISGYPGHFAPLPPSPPPCFPHFLDDSTVILEEHAFPRLVFHTFLNKAAGKVPDIRWYAIAQFVNRCLSKQFKWISKIWDFVHFVLNVFSQIMLEYDHYSFKIKLVNNANPRAGIIGVGDQCNFPIILPRSGQKFKNESITL